MECGRVAKHRAGHRLLTQAHPPHLVIVKPSADFLAILSISSMKTIPYNMQRPALGNLPGHMWFRCHLQE
jgi:hypothetical protein